MGRWKSERGRVSDAMADILGDAIKQIGQLEDKFTIINLADAIEFVTYGYLTVEINPKLQEVIDHSSMSGTTQSNLIISEMGNPDIITIPNRGQIAKAKEMIEASFIRDLNKRLENENINGNACLQ